MELMRDKVAFLMSEQRAKYSGKTIPLSASDYTAWNVSRSLVSEMEAGYRQCWIHATGANEELAAHAALIIQRIIRYIGLQMLMSGFIYRRFDSALWMRLHMQWMEAEERGLTEIKIKDSVGAASGYFSFELERRGGNDRRLRYVPPLQGRKGNPFGPVPRRSGPLRYSRVFQHGAEQGDCQDVEDLGRPYR